MILVPLLNSKFANTLAARPCELRVRGTGRRCIELSRTRARKKRKNKERRVPAQTQQQQEAAEGAIVSSRNSDAALVLFSGGQDSTVCLAWALERFARVETVGFDYGQRHRVELDVRQLVRERMTALRPHWSSMLGADLAL